ncbi:TraR/DksA C4-type zinc finger protein [Paenibacillus sp. PR3]|uniref:TraR/DksA C4-type zinc finger protein n=1 Tax=Paenibacillus terricola TaxID=2763503 RepID=A0ABR8MSM3_9BACL|nr:TraR/DksA C4-type zinc finger protein [Paenibacillus terricola]
MTTLNEQQIAQFRSRLIEMSRSIKQSQHDSEEGGLANSLKDETGELSPIDNHPGDVATEMFERSKDLAIHELLDFHLERIDAALVAIDNGTYGKCITCGQAIPIERLEALPDSLYCTQHAPRQELSNRRPAEEDFLQPAFGRSRREEDGYVEFDGEDAWQIVEHYGNSNSPAMSENREVDSYNEMYTEADENEGFVETIESFLATDITGRVVSVVRNRQYHEYMSHGEGDDELSFNSNDKDEGSYDGSTF